MRLSEKPSPSMLKAATLLRRCFSRSDLLGGVLQKLTPGGNVRIIDNLDDLDKELEAVDKAFRISDDEGRKRLSRFRFAVDLSGLPRDPFSPEYLQYQLDLYSRISGRLYGCPVPIFRQQKNRR